jgi:SSS family solute:Na+ symporter
MEDRGMVSTALALVLTVITLVVFAALGIWYSRGRVESIEDFISVRGTAGSGTLTATLIASSMGAWILLSPAQAGAAFGGLTAIIGYAAGSALALAAYAVVGPRIRTLIPEGHSLTEYALARYGKAMYAYVLVVSLLYMFIFVAAELTGIAVAFSVIAGVPRWITATLVGLFVLAYTAYGGLTASIFTDTIQTLLILPLLVVGFAGALFALGGTGEIYRSVIAANPQLLSLGFVPGLKFGIYVVLAVIGAEMLNQAWWQRVYAARNERTLRRSFLLAALAVFPMVFLSGLFGLAAVGLGLVDGPADASIAFFLVVETAFPEWAALAVVLLALLLVTSSADTLFNAIASLVTTDLPRILDNPSQRTLTAGARLLTVVVAVCAVWVAVRAQSVLALFLTADLLAAATFIPLLSGLYTGRVTGTGAFGASLLGLAVGVVVFPGLRAPLVTIGLGPILPAPSYFRAFLGAVVVSSGLTAFAASTGREFDLDSLSRAVDRLDEPGPETDGGTANPSPSESEEAR